MLRLSVGETRDGDFSLRITETLSEQAYEITINENGVQILGGDGAGVLLWSGNVLSDLATVRRSTTLYADHGCAGHAKPWLLF